MITEFPSSQRCKVKSRILRTEVFDVHCICRMPMMDQRWCAVILAINGFILLVLKILIVEINGIALCVVMRNHNWHLYHINLTRSTDQCFDIATRFLYIVLPYLSYNIADRDLLCNLL